VKLFLLGLALLFAATLLPGVGTASAASLTQTDIIASAIAGNSVVVKVQGYGGGGDSDRDHRRRGYDDDGDRGHRRDERASRREYCFNCARRCDHGFCPPRCWGWRKYCHRDRSY
jgi:hypothetical protein